MDFAFLPPEINSGRMYSGPGAAPMLAAAAAWDDLADELSSTAAAYASTVSGLTSGTWQGPSSQSMTAAASTYVDWMNTTAAQAEETGSQAKAAVAAYEAAFAATVPPPVIEANRALLAMLVATNILGQNTPAIAATESALHGDVGPGRAAMYGYAGSAAAPRCCHRSPSHRRPPTRRAPRSNRRPPPRPARPARPISARRSPSSSIHCRPRCRTWPTGFCNRRRRVRRTCCRDFRYCRSWDP